MLRGNSFEITWDRWLFPKRMCWHHFEEKASNPWAIKQSELKASKKQRTIETIATSTGSSGSSPSYRDGQWLVQNCGIGVGYGYGDQILVIWTTNGWLCIKPSHFAHLGSLDWDILRSKSPNSPKFGPVKPDPSPKPPGHLCADSSPAQPCPWTPLPTTLVPLPPGPGRVPQPRPAWHSGAARPLSRALHPGPGWVRSRHGAWESCGPSSDLDLFVIFRFGGVGVVT